MKKRNTDKGSRVRANSQSAFASHQFLACSALSALSELPDDKFSNVIMDCAVLRSMWFPELRDNNEEETGQIGGMAPPSNEEKAEAGRPKSLFCILLFLTCTATSKNAVFNFCFSGALAPLEI